MSIQDNIITKNFIKIPTYKKAILIGGKKYKQLLKQGIVDGDALYKYDKNILFKIDLNNFIYDKINQLNKELPDGYEAVKGRGLYKNFIIKKKITDSDNMSTTTIMTDS